MIQKAIDSIKKEDIESLVSAKVGESRTLDYKQQLPDNTDEKKREVLYDVSSFANAAGGDLVFGIADERDANGKSTGLPAAVEGVNIPNLSDAIARLENLVRDGITPRIVGIEWKSVEGFTLGPVLVMRVPKSTIGPHMVIFGGMARFYSRNSTGKYPMDYSEIRSAFVESTDIGERLRGFRMARVRQILAGETLLGTILAPIVALHLIPLSSLGLGAAPDVSREAAKAQVLLQPIRAGSWGGHFNFDGYLVRSTTARSYVQVFRSGAIEAGDASLLDIKQPGYEKQIPSIAFEATIIECLQRYVDVQRRLAIQLPVFMTITLLRIKGFTMSSTYSFLEKNPPIDRETLPLPEVVVEDYAANVGKLLQPSFDALWQACGLEKSRNYDDAGNWRAHRC